MDIFPSFLPVLGHGVFHAVDSQCVLRLQTRHTSREVGMRTQMKSLSVVVLIMITHFKEILLLSKHNNHKIGQFSTLFFQRSVSYKIRLPLIEGNLLYKNITFTSKELNN